MNPFNANRLRRRREQDAVVRNPRRCVCMHEFEMLVPTKRGLKRVGDSRAAAAHLTSCQHSELKRTTMHQRARRTFAAPLLLEVA